MGEAGVLHHVGERVAQAALVLDELREPGRVEVGDPRLRAEREASGHTERLGQDRVLAVEVVGESPGLLERGSGHGEVARRRMRRRVRAIRQPLRELQQVGSGPDRVPGRAVPDRSGDDVHASAHPLTDRALDGRQPVGIGHDIGIEEDQHLAARRLDADVPRPTGHRPSSRADPRDPRMRRDDGRRTVVLRGVHEDHLVVLAQLRSQSLEDGRQGRCGPVGGHDDGGGDRHGLVSLPRRDEHE